MNDNTDELQQLMATLMECWHFEDAAAATLRVLLRVAEEALAASPYAGRGRILRGMVHLIPGESYLRIASLEADAPAPVSVAGSEEIGAQLLASSTAWRTVLRHRTAVAIDVHRDAFQAPPRKAGDAPMPPIPAKRPGLPESRERFLGRKTSHVYAMPLCVPGGAIEGMITLEAHCLAAVGKDFIWQDRSAPLQALVELAAPYLVSLEVRPRAPATQDELLPVVGATVGALLPIARVFAEQDETLFISGPTGAGKSRLARWCHARSLRPQGPFEALELSTVPRELQMAELFGWRKGAFTGAHKDTPGAVARAEGGTLFIDEVDKLSLETQAGLLQLLETRSYRVLGEGGGERRADIRFIVGTNANLSDAVREGRFREDLYYRINVLPIRLPPLQERRDEIPLWARFMATRRHRERVPQGEAQLVPEAERLLSTSDWPGNLRQLDNIIRRAYALALAELGGTSRSVTLEERHVAQALKYDVRSSASRPALVDALQAAAERFVDGVEQRAAPLDMDLADAFRGFVLGTAVRRLGREEAFRKLGREKLVVTRNHHRTLKRELERVDELCQELAQGRSSLFSDVLSEED